MAKSKACSKDSVFLTTGYEIPLDDKGWRRHLYKAAFGENTEVLHAERKKGDLDGKAWGEVYDLCICEMFYVAGQLRAMGRPAPLPKLLSQFNKFWNWLTTATSKKTQRMRKK